jgi:hypothetical protein
MLSKCSIDAAEDVLKAYERAMRGIVRQGHLYHAEGVFRTQSLLLDQHLIQVA